MEENGDDSFGLPASDKPPSGAEGKTTKTKDDDQDDFESSFLASLDSTMEKATAPGTDKAAATQPPAHKAKAQPATKPARRSAASDAGARTAQDDEDNPFDFDSPLPKQPQHDIPFQLRDSLHQESSATPIWKWLAGITLSLLLSAALFVQLSVFRSTDVVDALPAAQPLLMRICQQLPCRYTGPTDISKIKLISRDIRLHPKAKNALLITATMVNRAKFKQPYPILQIRLSDLSGDVVAQRRFRPEEYLGKINNPFLRMPPGKPVKIALEVIDPGRDAVNFEIEFH